MLNFTKLADEIDVDQINQIVEDNMFLFEQIKVRQEFNGTSHGDTRSIFLRWCREMLPEAVLNDLTAVEYPAMQTLRPTVDDTISRVMEETGGKQLGRILLVELKPSGFIKPHPDEGPYAEYFQRFHLCLKSGGKCCFTVENDSTSGEYVHMMPGELWWFNHRKKHSVFNADDEPRWHLIFDIVAPNFRTLQEEESMGSV